jgi:BlaI family transcriptional regulator, penicillinase repressor
MAESSPPQLSRRERQIMEILYARAQASVGDVLDALPDPPSYSAVRAMLRLLEEKGRVRHKQEGRKFVYVPTVPAAKARRWAMRNLLQTFFGGSVSEAVASLIEMDQENLSPEDLSRLTQLIEKAKKEGR